MTDAEVPNKSVYRAYLEDEWLIRKKWYMDPSIRSTIRDFWYCDVCERIYSRVPIDGFYYTYTIQFEGDAEEGCTCLENGSNTIKVYALNDEEEDVAWDCVVDRGEEPIFSREVRYCTKCKRIYIKKNDKVKKYRVEEVVPYIQKDHIQPNF